MHILSRVRRVPSDVTCADMEPRRPDRSRCDRRVAPPAERVGSSVSSATNTSHNPTPDRRQSSRSRDDTPQRMRAPLPAARETWRKACRDCFRSEGACRDWYKACRDCFRSKGACRDWYKACRDCFRCGVDADRRSAGDTGCRVAGFLTHGDAQTHRQLPSISQYGTNVCQRL